MHEVSHPHESSPRDDSRRGFIRGSSLLLAGALPTAALASVAANPLGADALTAPRSLKVGLIGCGYQGISAASELLATASRFNLPVSLVALADAFPDRLQQAVRTLRSRHSQQVAISADARFVGLQGYRELLATDVDLVLLATPPVFRPVQFEAAVAAGKHVHVELPIAIDVPGLTRFQQAAQEALAHHRRISAGWLQSRDQRLVSTLQQLQQGLIGPIVSIQAFHPPHAKPLPADSSNATDFHWQLRNWMHFPWASGGSIVERRVRSLALVNSLLNEQPVVAQPVATKRSDHATRSAEAFQDDWQVAIEYTYPSGANMISQAWDGKAQAVGRGGQLVVQGVSGWCDWMRGEIYDSQSRLLWRASDHPDALPEDIAAPGKLSHSASPLSGLDPWATLLTTASHTEYIHSAQLAANSTMAALMGRMAVSQQTRITWEEASQSTQLFDSISRPTVELGVDRVPTIERYLTATDS